MNFYHRWIGDWAALTAHLSLSQQGALGALFDHYIATERPYPAELDILYRICRATCEEERQAVESVATEFFPICQDGLRRNDRADHLIAQAKPRIEAARRNGQKGGHKHATQNPALNPTETQREPSGVPTELIFPKRLSTAEIAAIGQHLAGLAIEQAQQILDELQGQSAVKPVSNPVGYVATLSQKAKIGNFVPTVALTVATARKRQEETSRQVAEAGTCVKPSPSLQRRPPPPEAMDALKGVLRHN